MHRTESLLIGIADGAEQRLQLDRANRHGLIAGATGTGKTVTVQGMAEGFSTAGVPVFLADVKGDLAGLAMPGSPTAPVHAALAGPRHIGRTVQGAVAGTVGQPGALSARAVPRGG